MLPLSQLPKGLNLGTSRLIGNPTDNLAINSGGKTDTELQRFFLQLRVLCIFTIIIRSHFHHHRLGGIIIHAPQRMIVIQEVLSVKSILDGKGKMEKKMATVTVLATG